MSTITPTLPEIIADLDKRLSSLETAPAVAASATLPVLTITNLTSQVSQYVETTTGQMRGRVLLDWDDVVNPNSDNLNIDPFSYYEVYYRLPGETTPVITKVDQSAAVFNNLPLDTSLTFGVRAVTKSDTKGTWTTTTINTSHDTTPPVQPSTPTVTASLKGVIVTWDGKDVAAAAMAADFAYCEVHVSKTGATFTPTAATYVNRLYKGGGVLNILSDDTYATLYIRLVAYDTSGNASVASTAGSATPVKAVSTDINVALPGDIAYRDEGNLIVDGSFESAIVRATRAASAPKVGTWTFDNTSGFAAFGDWCIKVTGDATVTKNFYLTGYSDLVEVPVVAGTKLYLAARIRGVSANGTASLYVQFRSQTDVLTNANINTSTSTGSYVLIEGAVTIPADCKTISVFLQTQNQTTGTWYFDALQVRAVVGTALIEDAAITNAKIANLAVNDAKIADLSAAKITTGQLQASTEIIAGSTTTAHARLTGTGLHIYSPDLSGDGIPDEVIRLGTTTDDFFGIVNGSGTLLSSIDSTGKGNFTDITVNGDPTLNGKKLSEWLAPYPKGTLKTTYYDQQAAGLACTTEVGVGIISINEEAGRNYRLRVQCPFWYTTSASCAVTFRIRVTDDGTNPTITSPALWLESEQQGETYSHQMGPHFYLDWTGSAGVTRKFLLSVLRSAGSGTPYWYASTGRQVRMAIEDIGPAAAYTSYVYNNGGGSGAPATTRYTSTWQSTAAQSYLGSNAVRSTSSNYQGYYSSTNGVQKSAWFFGNNAISGETSKTIAAALAGATVERVWVYCNFEHWYWNSGGTARIVAHNATSPPGSRPGTWDLKVESANWPKPGARWVELPANDSGWVGTYRGFGIDGWGSTDPLYYGYATGGTSAQIQIQYVR